MYIGVDLGTSSVKLILVKRDGTILRTISKSFDLIYPHPSWSEQNPEDWLRSTLEGLKELVLGHEDEITGISFSGQMHGLVLLDKNGKVLRNAILWNDQRTKNEVEYLNHEVGIAKLLEYTGNIALTGLTAPKILWVRKNEPEIFERIDKILLPKDYLVYQLSGSFASDVSDSSGTLYFDPRTKKYHPELLALLDIRLDQLPAVYESHAIVGHLKEDYRTFLGITSPVNIVIGGGDQAVGAIGSGIVNEGDCSISLGTSGVVFVASDHFVVDDKSYLQSYAHANGKYHIMGVMLNAAGALKWWQESVHQNHDYDRFFNNVNSASTDESIFFLPYLSGERSPINDPDAKGVFFGLQAHHQKNDLDRAIVEGVTFALRDSLELIRHNGTKIDSVRIIGGGAKSDVWAQMIADVMDVEVIKNASEEGPAFGAAILAMVGCGEYPSVPYACSQLVKTSSRFQPDEKTKNLYEKKYRKFQKLYPQIKDLFQSI